MTFFHVPENCDPALTSAYDYHLPEELIATHPAPHRPDAKMLVVHTQEARISHHHFRDLPSFLLPHDLLVFNDTRVLPGRVMTHKAHTGGRVELFVLAPLTPAGDPLPWDAHAPEAVSFRCLTRTSKPLRPGATLHPAADPDLVLKILSAQPGRAVVSFPSNASTPLGLLERLGQPPLPPYIVRRRRTLGEPELLDADTARYQTVFARQPGAVAAPTAGLHLTDALLQRLSDRGVARTGVTLHVGLGTFKPVDVDALDQHPMHSERYIVGEDLRPALDAVRAHGARVVAVGTTSARVLETEARLPDPFAPGVRDTDIMLHPGNPFEVCDALITNFHLPRSTLLAMIAARLGYPLMRRVYDTAIEHRYRFYSYGDGMLILP